MEAFQVNELYLLRHGIAVDPGSSGMPDDARALTEKGIKRMHQIAKGLLSLDLDLDAIATSPLVRARQTAEIVADALGLSDQLETSSVLSTGSDPATIERWLRSRAESRLLLVGHNPTLSELVSLMVSVSRRSPICDLKKGGIAALAARPRIFGPLRARLASPSAIAAPDWPAVMSPAAPAWAQCARRGRSHRIMLSRDRRRRVFQELPIKLTDDAAAWLIGLVSQSSSAMF